jgi:hypothetical protein
LFFFYNSKEIARHGQSLFLLWIASIGDENSQQDIPQNNYRFFLLSRTTFFEEKWTFRCNLTTE